MADTKITETYEYNTSIITSYDGKEQRLKTRQYPRRRFSFDYDAMDVFQAQWIRALLRQKQNRTQYIPLWFNVTPVVEDVLGGKIIKVPINLLYNFENCDYVELFYEDDPLGRSKNMVRKVRHYRIDDENNVGVIELKDPVSKGFRAGTTFVYPLINTCTQPSSDVNYVFARGTHTVLNFEEVNAVGKVSLPAKVLPYEGTSENFNMFNLPQTFNDREVFLFTPTWEGDESANLKIDKNVNKLDNNTGIFQYDLKSNYYYDTQTWDINLLDKSMIFDMKRFFRNVSGRYKAFYCPTWVNDIEPYEDIVGGQNYIITEFNGMYDYYEAVSRKKYIVILTRDFQTKIYKIFGYTTDTRHHPTYGKIRVGKILLSENVSETIPLDNIMMISYLNLVRFDSDEIQFNYETDCVATTTVSFKEVDV